MVLAAFPGAEIGFEVDTKRQGIVDSWPADVDDSRRPPRLGLRTQVRPPDRLHRLPDPHHPRPLPPRLIGLVAGASGSRARPSAVYRAR